MCLKIVILSLFENILKKHVNNNPISQNKLKKPNRVINHINICPMFFFYLINLFGKRIITNKKAYVPPT